MSYFSKKKHTIISFNAGLVANNSYVNIIIQLDSIDKKITVS